jgi:Diacylglycerol acyltransferase
MWGKYGTPIPLSVPRLSIEIGKPLPVLKREGDILDSEIQDLHATFVKEMIRLFERTKVRNGCIEGTKLTIL